MSVFRLGGVVNVVMVMMMVVMTSGKRHATKRHEQQSNSKNLLHRENPSMRFVSNRRILTPPVSKVQRKWQTGGSRRESRA
jgi:hypothetical protein